MAAQWTESQLTTLLQNLADGFRVQQMIELIPTRKLSAIIQKAQKFGFGVTTSKVDRITRFYANIKSRVRDANVSTATDDSIGTVNTLEDAQLMSALQSNSFEHLEPELRIVPYDGVLANMLAVRMLTENNLSVDPDIIYQLSLHILKEQL